MRKGLFYLFFILISCSFLQVKSLDYTGLELNAVIPPDGFSLSYNNQEITVRSDGSTNLEDYNTPLEYAQGRFKINVIVPSGQVLHADDYIKIPITNYYSGTKRDVTVTSLDWTDLMDNTNTIIGRWSIHDSYIHVIFNESVEGKSSISQLELVTGLQSIYASKAIYDRIGKIKFGEQEFFVRIDAIPLTTISTDRKWQSGGSSNNNVYWGIRLGVKLTRDIWNSRGGEGELSEMIVEDSFPGAESVTFSSNKALYVPVSLTGNGISEKVFRNFNINSAFRKLTQVEGESYEEFRERVISTPMQYGIFIDTDKTPRFIAYCGRLGVDTPLYTEANIETMVNDFIIDEIYEESDRETLIREFKKAYLEGKTGGHATSIRFYLRAYYPKTNVERTISNTATVTYDGVSSQLKRNGVLSATSGVGETTSAKVLITKKDQNTNELLKGAKIKLQFRDDEGWVDYTYPVTGKIENETDEHGSVLFENLPVGTFRAVEVEAPIGYDGEVTSEEFEVASGSNFEKHIEMFNVKHLYQIITHHYKEGTTEKLGEDVSFGKYYGESYTTSALTNIPEGYVLVGNPGNANGTIDGSDVIVNYYYQLKDVTLTIKHLDKDSGASLVSDEVHTYSYGDHYTTSSSNNIPDYYELVEDSGNTSGEIKEDTVVTYYYQKKAQPVPLGKITVKYLDSSLEEIEESTVTTKEIGSEYITHAKEIEGYTLKEKPSTEVYTYTEEEQVVIYIYEKIKVKVEIESNDGGKIEGYEEVYYGEDSSVNKIKIIADPGYVIDTIKVNGEIIEIPKNSSSLVLSNFIQMKENKKIEVSFQKIEDIIVSPKTSNNLNYILISMICILGFTIIYSYKSVKNKKKE